ncbi:hypothetical protein O1611_g3143 [Lasiodiplodia mahajangana]|uniref:Uncharacterized protein n=1 Tax=Lasiodiplodia mahajangana TaxID=1108764 RepID=A0ACC2JTA2_9PEZI|nr:hypothetical protein O1611_g3143 [Lasiodiplodia mahajangana]
MFPHSGINMARGTSDASSALMLDNDPKTKKLDVHLQVNAEAATPGLKDWAKRNSTHGKLATTSFDTSAGDLTAELHKMMDEMVEQGSENLKPK